MKELDLVIFDMDGLMFDSEKIAYRTWQEVVTSYGYPFDFEFFQTMLGSNLERIKAICFKQFGDDFPFDEIKVKRYELTNEMIKKEGVPLKNGLVELLEFLNQKKIKKAVATSSNRERANIFLNHTEITQYFDYILCGDEITKSKPDPEIFLTVAKKFGARPEKTVVLEDSEAGITAAYKGNFMPIMVPDLIKPRDEIRKMTYQCFDSLLDVKELLEKELND